MKSTLSILLAMGVSMSQGIVLECDFAFHRTFWGEYYTCIAKNFTNTVENRTITEVVGRHSEGKTNDDVQKFFVNHGNCPVLPLNVGKFFKNLEIFYVMHSQVKNLTFEDLKGLDNLKVFDVSSNPIERIERGYFDGKSTIKFISFYSCSLTFVDSLALDPLINLEKGYFEYNRCVDYKGDHNNLVKYLKRHLKNCDGTKSATALFTPPDTDYKDEEIVDYEHDVDYESAEVITVEKGDSSTTVKEVDSSSRQVLRINECHMTFVERNAFLIITLLLLIVIVVAIISFEFGQYRIKHLNRSSETHQLSQCF